MKSIVFAIFALLALFSTANAQANCDTCTFVIGIVENWVESNATEAEIQSYLDTLCSLVPGYASVCDGIVNQGLGQVIQWIQENETPTEVCQQLGLCSSMKKLPATAQINHITIPTDDIDCTTCEYVITVVETWLDNANNQQDVITTLEVVCTYMPDWTSTCDAIIAYGVPTVVNWVEEYENATTVCTQIEECPSAKSCAKPMKPAKVDDATCGICGDIVSTIENYVAQGSTETEIENYLEIVCALIPQWSATCNSIVVSEVPQIISYLEQNQTPDQICTEINLCNP
jgi:saposin